MLQRPVESTQYTSIRYTGRLADAGAVASIGTVGDSYDNALAETVNGLYKTELVFWKGPWRNADDLELATLGWVEWFNHVRIHSALGYRTPAEAETEHYRSQQAPREQPLVGEPTLQQTRGASHRARDAAGRAYGNECHGNGIA